MDRRDLERILCDETEEPKALPLSLLNEITNGFANEQEIGKGAFAVVYKGMLENRNVAVKSMSNTYMYEKEFQREIECLTMVKHKNVVRFLGYCVDTQGSMEKYEGKFVMADVRHRLLCFEYLPKGILRKHITGAVSGLQWTDRYHIIKGICEGLHYLHRKNIVHLDLKPENILLDGNLEAKIADFGLSRCFDDMQSRVVTMNIGGTLGYLAPEFCNGEITYQFDIYSLGVIIIEILTGKKGYLDIDKIVESWRSMLEESHREVQEKQVRVCAQIGIECTNFDPAKRPDVQYILSRLDEIGSMDGHIETCGMTSQQINPYSFNGAMLLIWISYQQLNSDIRQCIEYCSIFPRGSKLRREKLCCLWIAQGFVKIGCATSDVEDVAGGYFQQLVSYSFLQPEETSDGEGCFTIHDGLHDLLDNVARNCFRIENAGSRSGEGWEGDVPRDVQHLLIQKYDAKLITEKVLGLENLLTLIVYVVDIPLEDIIFRSICESLPELRVLAIAFSEEYALTNKHYKFLVPESISELKHLRYLAFRTEEYHDVILPSTINKLQHIQVLDFGDGRIGHFNFGDHVNLRERICGKGEVPCNMGGLISLQTIRYFPVYDQGYELKQLRDLNKLRGFLEIRYLENIKSKYEALQANLAAKKCITELKLHWHCCSPHARCSRKVQGDVLEGLCPPKGLKKLQVWRYEGSRYPDWMVGKQNHGLQEIKLFGWRQQGPAPQLVEAFPRLCVVRFCDCSWNVLPDNMEQLVSLKILEISQCFNLQSLPTLPVSLELVHIWYTGREFEESCQKVGHPNWQKIAHVPNKNFATGW